mmetsp:Transcript_69497/g.219991  ORF Transcript_69497/g.219991 Transcript_69497/m.219991 type:complete len:259 (-) Transcript_69497:326-1102(-)
MAPPSLPHVPSVPKIVHDLVVVGDDHLPAHPHPKLIHRRPHRLGPARGPVPVDRPVLPPPGAVVVLHLVRIHVVVAREDPALLQLGPPRLEVRRDALVVVPRVHVHEVHAVLLEVRGRGGGVVAVELDLVLVRGRGLVGLAQVPVLAVLVAVGEVDVILLRLPEVHKVVLRARLPLVQDPAREVPALDAQLHAAALALRLEDIGELATGAEGGDRLGARSGRGRKRAARRCCGRSPASSPILLVRALEVDYALLGLLE